MTSSLPSASRSRDRRAVKPVVKLIRCTQTPVLPGALLSCRLLTVTCMWNGSSEKGDSSRRDTERSKTSYHVGRRSAGGTFSVENLRVVFSKGISPSRAALDGRAQGMRDYAWQNVAV